MRAIEDSINDGAIVLCGAITELQKRPGGLDTEVPAGLARTLRLPPRELAKFAERGDTRVRAAVPSAFTRGPLSRRDGEVFAAMRRIATAAEAVGAV